MEDDAAWGDTINALRNFAADTVLPVRRSTRDLLHQLKHYEALRARHRAELKIAATVLETIDEVAAPKKGKK
jgi:hypothetical protein